MSRAVKNFRTKGTYEIPTKEEEGMMAYYTESLLRQCAGQDEMTLDKTVYRFLYDNFPNWNTLVEDKQFKMAQRLVDFYENTQRFPSMDAYEPEEKKLHKFLARMRHVYSSTEEQPAGLIYRSVTSYLDENIPNWSDSASNHTECIQDVLMFIQFNHRMPHDW
jgi:hypothetical protein